jgi:hypothetical protein
VLMHQPRSAITLKLRVAWGLAQYIQLKLKQPLMPRMLRQMFEYCNATGISKHSPKIGHLRNMKQYS